MRLAWLTRLARRIERPIYFVLGNHDYYNGSIWEVRQAAAGPLRYKLLKHFVYAKTTSFGLKPLF